MTEMGYKTSSSWGWAFVIGGCAVFAYLSFFRKGRSMFTTRLMHGRFIDLAPQPWVMCFCNFQSRAVMTQIVPLL